MRRSFGLSCLIVILAACASMGFASAGAVNDAPDYPLDEVSRAVVAGEDLPCESGELELVAYKGEVVRYQRPVRIHPAFQEKLIAFEGIVDELAKEHFGRAPRRINHFGAYNCRPMRNHSHWMSEHALGNAIDVSGFDFGPLPRKLEAPPELAKALRRPFQIRVDKHWDASEKDAPKQAFLHALADRIVERPDVFRSVVGPKYRGHHNHFHLSYPPYRMVKVGEVRRWWW